MNDDGDAAAAAAVVCWHCSHGRAAPPPPLPYWWWWWCRYSFEVFVVPASELLLSLRAAAVHATSSATRPSPMAQATRHADATMRMRTPLPSPFLSLSCLVLYFLLLLVAQTDRREYVCGKGKDGVERREVVVLVERWLRSASAESTLSKMQRRQAELTCPPRRASKRARPTRREAHSDCVSSEEQAPGKLNLN